jgi:D-alanine--poly(phosphoribitol) ligase subunit 1
VIPVPEGRTFEPVIHVAVASQAARRPDATALVSGGRKASYGLLDAAASFYATELARLGVGPGDIVPVLLARSLTSVALQLGILKTGAAYANLDYRWPQVRLSAILEQISPVVTVAGEGTWHGRFPTYRPAAGDITQAAGRGAAFSSPAVPASAPATVFFTSGTTGGPKGVVSPHQAVTRLFRPGGLAGFGPGHATPQAAPLPWDMYAFELWGQLTSGGTVVLVAGDYLTPGALREAVHAHDVDTLWLTASLFNLFVDESPDSFGGLKQILTGGEKLSPRHVRQFLSRHPDIALWNGYGPAENCMLTTTRRLTMPDCDLPGGVPIGTEVEGTTVLLLDADGARCPAGREGEICIAGEGLATEYLGQPALTEDKFPAIDFDGTTVRVYRTGDLGVRDGDGVLHFRGRNDHQVKISGYRIEMTEIELAASAVPGVRSCIALPVTGPDGGASHLALMYLAADEGAALAASGDRDPLHVHSHLQRQLPGYMVPSVVCCLTRFPVTANGKLDREALHAAARRSPARPPSSGRASRPVGAHA